MSIGKIIEGLICQADGMSTSPLLQRAITLEGCIPGEDRFAPLTPAERHVIECATSGDRHFNADGDVSIAFRPHGRLYVLPRNEFEVHADFLTLLGHIELTESELREYLALRKSDQCALAQDRAPVLAYLLECGLESVCKELLALSDHMAPLIYYVGPHCFSNFYNIGKSEFKLETTVIQALQLVDAQRENSPTEFLVLAYCLHILLRSGSYTRLEELNSTQLSRSALEHYFDAKHAAYRKTAGNLPETEFFPSTSVEEKARLVAQMKKIIESTSGRFTRHINGVNLRKKEVLLAIPPVKSVASEDFAQLSAHGEATLQRWMAPGHSARKSLLPENVPELLQDMVPSEGQLFSSRLESLIDHVVSEAVRHTKSDFGMTRGVRDFLAFVEALRRQDAETVCAWGQGDYFCHVVPGEDMKTALAPRPLCMIVNAISGRMRFNSWHYAPSYLDIDRVPSGRGWFYAPRMADIADHSDMHHTGHVHAGVRYSIRSPLPICAGETVLPGFIDLRLMRQTGDPYTQEDLLSAITYTEHLQYIYQSLMNYLLKSKQSFAFSFGSKEWIDKAYSSRDPKIAAAAASA